MPPPGVCRPSFLSVCLSDLATAAKSELAVPTAWKHTHSSVGNRRQPPRGNGRAPIRFAGSARAGCVLQRRALASPRFAVTRTRTALLPMMTALTFFSSAQKTATILVVPLTVLSKTRASVASAYTATKAGARVVSPRPALVLRGGCGSSQLVSACEVAAEAAGDGGPPEWLPVSDEDFEPPDPFARAAEVIAGGEDRPLSDEDHLSDAGGSAADAAHAVVGRALSADSISSILSRVAARSGRSGESGESGGSGGSGGAPRKLSGEAPGRRAEVDWPAEAAGAAGQATPSAGNDSDFVSARTRSADSLPPPAPTLPPEPPRRVEEKAECHSAEDGLGAGASKSGLADGGRGAGGEDRGGGGGWVPDFDLLDVPEPLPPPPKPGERGDGGEEAGGGEMAMTQLSWEKGGWVGGRRLRSDDGRPLPKDALGRYLNPT